MESGCQVCRFELRRPGRNGAKQLGAVTSGPTQFKATNLTPGFHTFSVLGTDASGNVRTSNCAMVAVRK